MAAAVAAAAAASSRALLFGETAACAAARAAPGGLGLAAQGAKVPILALPSPGTDSTEAGSEAFRSWIRCKRPIPRA